MAVFLPSRFRSGRLARAGLPVILAGAVVAGCASPMGGRSVMGQEPSFLQLTQERAFAQALRQRYLELATNAYDRGDAARSDFYSLRALMAVEGKLAEPTSARAAGLGDSELGADEDRLTGALASGVRVGAPMLAARAQAAYDCWLVEAGEGGDAGIADACRFNALQAIAQLEAASVGAAATIAPASATTYAPSARPQRYVIDASTPAQTINAPGVDIEVVTATPAETYGYGPANNLPKPAPIAAPMPVETVAVADPLPVRAIDIAPAAPLERMSAPIFTDEVEGAAPASFDYGMPIVDAIELGPYADRSEMLPPQPEYTALAPAELMPVDLGPSIPSGVLPVESVPMIEAMPPIETGPVDMVLSVEEIGAMSGAPAPVAIPESVAMQGGDAEALLAAQANLRSDYAVFFGFDSAEITPEAEDTLRETVDAIGRAGTRAITLTGFTDSMGDARYNQLLAMRRAQAVRRFLQAELGGGIAFEILPLGEVAAVKANGDGVMQALNRKVEIALR